MKRRITSLLLALCLVLSLAATVSAFGDRITSGDWEYEISEGKAIICSYHGSATNVVVPAKIDGYAVSEVGPGFFAAFSGASNMKSVTLSEGIERINTNAFNSCPKLEVVNLPKSLRSISSSAFENCTKLREVNLNEGLKSIGRYAFLNTALTSIYIPSSVTTIDEDSIGYTGEWGDTEQVVGLGIFGWSNTAAERYASSWHFTFYRLDDLNDTSGRCGDYATWRFEKATGTLYIESTGKEDGVCHTDPYYNGVQPWIGFADSLRRVVIGEGITHLGDHSFSYNYPNLTEVILPKSISGLGNAAFLGCSGLTKCDFPAELCYFGGRTFQGTGLTKVVFPAEMEYPANIGGYCFADCPDLTYVKFPAEFDNTGDYLFANCPKLSQVDMSGMTYCGSVGDRMFYNCDSLTGIDFHTLTEINPGMYQDCDGLVDITIPESVTHLCTDAFADCDNLTKVLFVGNVPSYNNNVFRGCALNAWYPAGNATWTENHLHNHGGNITWVAYDPDLFVDVPMNSFYYESVLWAVENGITTGATDTTFNPNGQCQRAQIVTFLWRAAGCPVVKAENPFTDVPAGSFYYDAVLWAVENGITTGTSATTFSPFKTCSRAEVVTFLWRAHGKPGSNAENPFADVKDTDFFHTAVLWAVENGITNGMDATHFGSLTVCNRAQVVTFLYRAKDVPVADPDTLYTFELKTNDPTEEIGWAYCEGTEFAAGESVVFYAEPWFGYLVDFEAEGELELYYLGACNYELIMPDHDVTLTVNFVPAQGDAHHIRTTCENAEFYALCDVDEDFNDIAKPGEFVQFYVMANEGYTLTPENITLTAGGESWNEWWFLGQVSEPDPELEMGSIFVFEAVMPDADLDVSIICTAGDTAAANTFRAPVSVK